MTGVTIRKLKGFSVADMIYFPSSALERSPDEIF